MSKLPITASVGNGGKNNRDDVRLVQQRLLDLGFTMVGSADGVVGSNTTKGIQLFQSIKNGRQSLGGDGRVDVDGDTHRWMEATNAPRWMELSGQGTGYYNVEVLDETNDDHNYGTDWLNQTLIAAAQAYETGYRAKESSSLLTINDASPKVGGNTRDHKGHETGMCIDLRLPKKGHAGKAPGGRTHGSDDYDRDAMRSQLEALRAQPLLIGAKVFFNDPDLVEEGLCAHLAGHDNHVHAEIGAPEREDGR